MDYHCSCGTSMHRSHQRVRLLEIRLDRLLQTLQESLQGQYQENFQFPWPYFLLDGG